MILDSLQLIILIVTILGSVLAHGKVIPGCMSALEGRAFPIKSRVSHMEGLLEGFRATGLLSLSQSDRNQAQAAWSAFPANLKAARVFRSFTFKTSPGVSLTVRRIITFHSYYLSVDACRFRHLFLMIEPVVRIRIELLGVRRKIWRRIDVPTSSTLAMLHQIIQAAMGWGNYHLHEFQVEGRIYTEIMPDLEDYGVRQYDEKNLRLKTIFERGIRRMLYVYDFGDNWRHNIRIEGIRMGEAEDQYPAFVAGAGRCPPEDVGGGSGFERFIHILSDPAHEEHGEMVEWYGTSFDPDDFDADRARRSLGSLAAHRRRDREA